MEGAGETETKADRYRLFGTIGSPYALKLRAILRYQRLPFDWVPASLDWIPEKLSRPPLSLRANKEIAHVRPPVLPVVYFPNDGSYRNDSTFVAEALDAQSGTRAIIPPDPAVALLSHLLEDMADEWGVKIAFHYRWAHPQDRAFKSRIVTGELLGGDFDRATRTAAAEHFAARQVSRMPLVGCTPENAPLIVETFRRVLAVTDSLQEHAPFLFGPRPLLADFGWYGQLISLATDPTPEAIMRDSAAGTFTYLQMLEDASGLDEPWPPMPMATPKPARDLLRLAGEVYLPFLRANEKAFDASEKSFRLTILGRPYGQATFKYQVKCLNWLREELENLTGEPRARAVSILEEAGCLENLAR